MTSRISRRGFLRASGGAVTGVYLVGLAGCGDQESSEGGQVEIVFRQFDPAEQIVGLVEAIDQWNADHPKIQVTLENIPSEEITTQYTREVQAGRGPDIQHLPFTLVQELAKNGLLADLSSYVKDSPPRGGFDDFLSRELVLVDDKPYALPWTTSTVALAYRPDLLEGAGISEFPDTWESLLTSSQEISRGGNDLHGFCFTAGSDQTSAMWFIANAYLWSNGTFLVEETGSGTYEVGVAPGELAGAMDYFNAFFETGAAPRSMIGIGNSGEPVYVGALGRGDCAIIFLPRESFQAAQDQSEAPIMTALMPRGSEERLAHSGGRALGINPNSANPEAAWEFTKYLASREIFERYGYNQFPARQSLMDTLEFPEAEQGYVEMLPHSITFERYLASGASVPGMWAATNQEFGAVFSGQKTPEQASEDLIRTIEDLLQG